MSESRIATREEPPEPQVAASKDPGRVLKDSSGRPRVLIVDDNQDLANGLARWLELNGLVVEVAHDGKLGIEAARRFRPDFVLVDIGLPGMDGYMVASDLAREASLSNLTLIAISGYSPQDVLPASPGSWFHHHLVKPIDHAALLAILRGSGSAGGGGE